MAIYAIKNNQMKTKIYIAAFIVLLVLLSLFMTHTINILPTKYTTDTVLNNYLLKEREKLKENNKILENFLQISEKKVDSLNSIIKPLEKLNIELDARYRKNIKSPPASATMSDYRKYLQGCDSSLTVKDSIIVNKNHIIKEREDEISKLRIKEANYILTQKNYETNFKKEQTDRQKFQDLYAQATAQYNKSQEGKVFWKKIAGGAITVALVEGFFILLKN